VGARSTGHVLDSRDRGEARGGMSGQVDAYTRGRAGAIAQGITAAQQIGGDRLDAGERSALDAGQGRAIVDDIEGIGTGRADDLQPVRADVTDDRVDAIAHRVVDEVVAGTGVDNIGARAAGDRVVADIAGNIVISGPADQYVVASTTVDGIVAGAAVDGIVAGEPAQRVTTAETADEVKARRASDRVTAAGADQGAADQLRCLGEYVLGRAVVVDVGHLRAQMQAGLIVGRRENRTNGAGNIGPSTDSAGSR